jgi:hypothetical protein
MATSFDLGAGSFVRLSIHKVFGPYLSYPTPLNHPGRGASHSGLFVRGCSMVLHVDSCVYRRGASRGDRCHPLHPVAVCERCDAHGLNAVRAPQDHG